VGDDDYLCIETPEHLPYHGAHRVPVRPLDDLCAEQDFAPTALKIDVEGFEHEVLRGARDVVSRHRPTIFLEAHGHVLRQRGHAPLDLFAPLRAAGYRVESVEGSTAERLAAVDRGRVHRFICRP
jgi:hypothetical protein